MDSDNVVCGDGSEVSNQNGIREQLIASGQGGSVSDVAKETIGASTEPSVLGEDAEIPMKLEDSGTNSSCAGMIEKESCAQMQINDLIISKEVSKDGNQPTQSKPQKSKVMVKNVKASGPKSVNAVGLKKSKDGKEMDAPSTVRNGCDVPNAYPKQPMKTMPLSNSHGHPSKQSGKSATTLSEDLVEKTKLKPLKKGPHVKAEGDTHSSPTSSSGDTKSQRAGALPTYGFSFRCSERAEKRREFYTKLEEKTQAKEEEKNTLQAKTKESQQAEIKMLRKSLNFKATPMPSFYQEPPPPKVELKKIPTTRAKSPKFGRKKSKDNGDAEGNGSESGLMCRLSLDEKVTQNNFAKGVSPIHTKQPSRNSLPIKLPSAKKTSPKTTSEQKKSSLKVNHVKKPALSNATNEGKTSVDETPDSLEPVDLVSSTQPSKTQSDTYDGPVAEEQEQPTKLPELVIVDQ